MAQQKSGSGGSVLLVILFLWFVGDNIGSDDTPETTPVDSSVDFTSGGSSEFDWSEYETETPSYLDPSPRPRWKPKPRRPRGPRLWLPSSSGGHGGYENPAPGDDGTADCVPGQGPVYVGSNDPNGLDGDGDGWGCES